MVEMPVGAVEKLPAIYLSGRLGDETRRPFFEKTGQFLSDLVFGRIILKILEGKWEN